MKLPFVDFAIVNQEQLEETKKLREAVRYLKSVFFEERPDLELLEQFGTSGVRLPTFPLPPYYLYDIVYHSDTLFTIVRSINWAIFRNGFKFEPKFVKKCEDCQAEFDFNPADGVCQKCSGPLREPDQQQADAFMEVFKKSVNQNGHPLSLVCRIAEGDLEVRDDLFVLCLKEYLFNESGEIVGARVKEIVRANPNNMVVISDKQGRAGRDDEGNKLFVCPFHRKRAYKEDSLNMVCAECGYKLYRAFFAATKHGSSDIDFYYIDGECVHVSKYFPSHTYGKSPVVAVWQKVITLLEMDRY
ncbi:MAG: hypothetical protein Q7K34_04830, partial [archaeon]|nr:hypothetical protein [archaeon]